MIGGLKIGKIGYRKEFKNRKNKKSRKNEKVIDREIKYIKKI